MKIDNTISLVLAIPLTDNTINVNEIYSRSRVRFSEHAREMAGENNSSSATEKGVFDFSDGGRYIGEWNDDGANGHGVCVGPSNSGVFQGKWVNGNQSSGVFRWFNGQQYMGTWKDGMRHGLGKEVRPDSSEFSGDFTGNVRGPFGVLKLANGALYQGTWEAGLQDGVGVEVYNDKGIYKGQYKKGLRDGYGTRSSAEYEAHEKKQKEKNKTEMEKSLGLSSLDRKCAKLFNPMLTMEEKAMHPKNTSSSDSSKIVTKSFRSISTVNAAFMDSIESNVQIYEGLWTKDKRHGHGVLRVPGIYMYCGEWSGNSRTGNGILVYEDGRREEGEWERGRLVVPLKKKKLSIKYHQLETKVKQAHTLALQAADAARTKAMLAESRASAAASRAKLGMVAAETAKKDSNIAKEKSVLLEKLEHQQKEVATPTIANSMEFPDTTVTPLKNLDSPSLLSVQSMSPTPSYENLTRLLPSSKSFDVDLNRTEDASTLGRHTSAPSFRNETGLVMSVEEPDFHTKESNSHSKDPFPQYEVKPSDSPETVHRRHTHQLDRQMPLRVEPSFSEPSLATKDYPEVKKRRTTASEIDKSTGEVVTVFPDALEDNKMDLTSATPTNPTTTRMYTHKAQAMNMDVLKQMANWNQTIAYINFILLLFLLLLIVFMVAFLSTTISHNNPTNFMNPLA